ncbi:MAG: PAS domain S-box protein [Bacteroidota bacterium]
MKNDYKVPTKSGEIKWLHFSTKAIIKDGIFKGGSGTLIDITEKKQSEIALQQSEAQYKSIINASPDVITITDLEGKVLLVSPKALDMFGYDSSDDFKNRSLLEFIDVSDHERAANNLKKMFGGELWGAEDYKGVKKNGSTIDINVNGDFIKDENGQPINMVFVTRDITEKKIAEERVNNVQRIKSVISEINKTIVTEKDKDKLLKEVCDIIIDTGKFEMAWLGMINVDLQIVKPVYHYGKEDGYLSVIKSISIKDTPEGRGTTGTAIREGKYSVCNDFENDPRMLVWREEALKRNYRSSIALPFKLFGKVVGVISIYSSIKDNFNQEEINLLEEVVENINFALDSIETENKRIEAINALTQSEEKYRALFYESPDGYLIVKDGVFIDCNRAAEILIGGDRSAIIGKTPPEISPEYQPNGKKSIEYVDEVNKEAFESGKHLFEWYIKRVDGTIFLTQINLSAIDYDGGQALLVSWRDITQQREAEGNIRKLSQAVEQSPVSIVITNIDGDIVYANPKACETTGYNLDELIGKNPRVLKSGETKDEEYKVLWDNISTGNNWQGIFHNKKKTGEFYWESSNITPIFDSKGEITNYLAVKEDITERLETQYELQKSEERFRQISEQSKEVIWEIDAEGLFTYISSIAIEVFGYTPEEMIDKMHFYELVDTNDQDLTFIQALETIKKHIEIKDLISTITKKDGNKRIIITNGLPMFDNYGTFTGYRGVNIDITEKKLADDELIKFKTIVDKASYGKGISTLNGDLLYANEALAIMHGWEPKELEGKNLRIFTDESQKKRLKELIDKLFIEGSITSEEIEHVRKDGTTFPTLMSATVIYNDKNEPQYLAASAIDISELKQAEKALKESEESLNKAQEIAKLGSWEHNFITNELKCSDYYYTLLGLYLHEHKDDLYDYCISIVHPEDLSVVEYLQKNDYVENKPKIADMRLIMSDGSIKWLQNNVIPIFENGVLVGLKGVNIDITDRKLKDIELTKLYLAVEQSPVSIVITDKDAKIEYVNLAFQVTTGYSIDELIGNNPKILKSGKTDKSVYEDLWATILNGDNWHGEWINKKKNEELYWESISITPIYDENKIITNFLAIKQDITERKKAEQEIYELNANLENKVKERTLQLAEINSNLQNEIEVRVKAEEEMKIAKLEAEQANLAKSEFLSRMSHELRTPMNSILGFAQLLGMGELNQGQKKGVNHILNSGKHLLNLINEVLDISRIEAGRLSLSMEPVQINGIIMESIDIVRPHTAEKQITLELIETSTNQLFVKADKQRLKQVLINLINNAVKYNKTKGSVIIKTELISHNLSDLDPIRISIIDNGIGISDENIPKLFNPFERAGADKTATEGTGLGLSVVKKLVEAMGGTIGVESKEGEGSTFWFELPQSGNQIKKAEESGYFGIDTKLEDKKGTILYIEDNNSNTELVEHILKAQRPSIRLITSTNGKEAVKLAIDNKPDLILLDLNLPDIHGSEVLNLLMNNESTKSIPVIIITADAMSNQNKKLINAGAKAYLTKSLDLTIFIEEIDKYLIN